MLALPLAGSEKERTTLLESILLGAAGFLPSQRPDLGPLDYESSQYAEESEAIWQAHRDYGRLSIETAQRTVRFWQLHNRIEKVG